MDRQHDTLIIIPAFNEQENIGRVIREIRDTGYPVDVVVINDGSTDATARVAREAGAVVINLPFNLGIGGAVQTGFKYALRHGYEYAIQLDGDGQHVAAEIRKILDPVKGGEADMAIGSRYLAETDYKTPLMRRLGMLVFSFVNSALVGQKITDNTSGFRAFSRRAILFLAKYYPADYPEPEAVVVLGRNGFKIKEVPVRMRPRAAGESSINAFRSVYYMVKVLLAIFVDVFKSYQKVSA
ncbi:MAG: glycosyltransferase family 2 protein [candidate division KSB1 bacterium]|nr:glycosyltransferase family 2 protein [candidate division KSB1 bacterium]